MCNTNPTYIVYGVKKDGKSVCQFFDGWGALAHYLATNKGGNFNVMTVIGINIDSIDITEDIQSPFNNNPI